MLRESLVRNWWVVALRGALAIVLGILALFAPLSTLSALIMLFAAYAFVDGVFALAAGFSGWRHHQERWWAALIEGVLGIVAGVVAFLYPALTAVTFAYLVAFWAIITGVFEIAAAIRLRRVIENEWLLGLAGAASVITGFLVLAAPGAGLVALTWVWGVYLLFFGALQVALGLRLRSLNDDRTHRGIIRHV